MDLPLPQGRKGRLLVVVAVLVGLAAFTFLLPKLSDTIEGAIEGIADSIGKWAYLLVGLLAMAETAAALGFIAPGEVAVIVGGVLAGEGALSIELLIGVVWASIVIGDSIGFWIGRKLGRSFVERHGKRFPTARKHFGQVEQFFRDHGGRSVFVGRWIGFVRPLMPFTAGTSGMRYRTFLPYDVISGGIWGTTFCLLGYIFWRNFGEVTKYAGRGALALGLLIILIVLAVRTIRGLRDPVKRARWASWIARQGERPLLRPLARVVRWVNRVAWQPAWTVLRPSAVFAWRRVTPGELGVELTSLVAIAGVCAYMIFLQVDLLNHHTLLFGDRLGLDVSHDIQSGFLTALARTVSFFGRFGVVLLAIVGAGGFLLGRGRRAATVVLATGFITTEIAVQIMKHAVERPRPADEIVHAGGFAYPSGHAAISIGFVAIGVLIAYATDRAVTRTVWLAATIGLAVAIGLSRVYLRVHYFTDVIGGWALGLAVFSALGAIGLIVSYVIRPDPTPNPGAER